MPDTAPNRQINHGPAWLNPVKRAVWVMSVLIVVGLGLLAYGLATRIGGLAPTPQGTPAPQGTIEMHYPSGQTLRQVIEARDGGLLLVFDGEAGQSVVRLAADGESFNMMVLKERGDAFKLVPNLE